MATCTQKSDHKHTHGHTVHQQKRDSNYFHLPIKWKMQQTNIMSNFIDCIPQIHFFKWVLSFGDWLVPLPAGVLLVLGLQSWVFREVTALSGPGPPGSAGTLLRGGVPLDFRVHGWICSGWACGLVTAAPWSFCTVAAGWFSQSFPLLLFSEGATFPVVVLRPPCLICGSLHPPLNSHMQKPSSI